MTGLSAAVWTETLKARRSLVPWLTALGLSLAPLVGGLFMLILKDPDWARGLGLISTKAQITAGTADWPTYFGLLAQSIAVGGFILFGIMEIWIFGREFSLVTLVGIVGLAGTLAWWRFADQT